MKRQHTIAALPVVTLADAKHPGDYRRVLGMVASKAVYWAPQGTGRGGNNYAGAGVLVALPSGGEALLLAESMAVPDFKGMMANVHDGELTSTGKVIDHLTSDQHKYYGFDESAFPAAASKGRVMLLLSSP